ncbi:uncharacterized protein LOC116950609 isoform X1 [Petromyzon marinus]|uniref:uncharacterized protein LOC116950609 isoform X1 n=2 Tax=Petromyzon marinus TaxID=7757 RepID=UPI003F705AA6
MPLSGGAASEARLARPPGGARLHLLLGAAQIGLGALNVVTSLAALTLAASAGVRHSCPFWAGLCALLCGLIGVVSWKRPIAIVIKFFMVLSAVCVMLNLAGSILSCQKAQLVSSLHHCHTAGSEPTLVCVCCENPKLNGCSNAAGDSIRLYPALQGCQFVRHSLKDLLFAVCALSVVSVAVCVLATSTRCMQIVSSDALHTFITHRLEHGIDDCPNPRDSYFTGEDYDDFVAPAPPPPYDPPAYAQHAPPEPLRPGSLGLVSYPLGLSTGPSGESPDGWCPTELPPPYEAAVLGNAFLQTSSLEEQITDTSSYTTSNYHHMACHDGGQSPGATSAEGTASDSEDATSAGSYSVRAQGSTRSLEPSPSTTDATTPTLASCCSSLGASDSPAEDGDRVPGYCERCGTCAAEVFLGEDEGGPDGVPRRRSDGSGPRWTGTVPSDGADAASEPSVAAACSCFGESGTETDLTASDEISVENFQRRCGSLETVAEEAARSAEERGEDAPGSPGEQDDGWRSGDDHVEREEEEEDERGHGGRNGEEQGEYRTREVGQHECSCAECRCGEVWGMSTLAAGVLIVRQAEVHLISPGKSSKPTTSRTARQRNAMGPEQQLQANGSAALRDSASRTRPDDWVSDDELTENVSVANAAATAWAGEAGCRGTDGEVQISHAAEEEEATAQSTPVEEDAAFPPLMTEPAGLGSPSVSHVPQPQRSAKTPATGTP